MKKSAVNIKKAVAERAMFCPVVMENLSEKMENEKMKNKKGVIARQKADNEKKELYFMQCPCKSSM